MSFLCAVHCLATPFVLVLLPAIGEHYLSSKIENGLIIGSLLIAYFFIGRDYKMHFHKGPVVLLTVSTAFLLLNVFYHNHALSILGSVAMASAYLLNWRLHRKVCHNSVL